ncbi:hypothetical protein Patl1_26451 [Pistacia atlantica]|uniref:Uncharacterized protein n=1 Tax=Pistacia atlantica TaxID=434234 RepID=A0ACC1B300_9ROSI|nr:hypothetical protein Patl1_26451 [Pistacia atlantica]
MACCFDSALKTAVLFAETKSELPLSFLIFSFANLLTFLSLFLAKFIAPKFAVVCQVMEKVAVVSAVTAFIITIAIPFPQSLKCITWALYAISLLILLISKYYF